MPPPLKQGQKGSSVQLAFRIDPDLGEALKRELARRKRERPREKAYLSDVIRELLWRALEGTTMTQQAAPIPSRVPKAGTQCPKCLERITHVPCVNGCGNVGAMCSCERARMKNAGGVCESCQRAGTRERVVWGRPTPDTAPQPPRRGKLLLPKGGAR